MIVWFCSLSPNLAYLSTKTSHTFRTAHGKSHSLDLLGCSLAPPHSTHERQSEVGLLSAARQEVCVWNLAGCVHVDIFSVAFWEISGYSWWREGKEFQ